MGKRKPEMRIFKENNMKGLKDEKNIQLNFKIPRNI